MAVPLSSGAEAMPLMRDHELERFQQLIHHHVGISMTRAKRQLLISRLGRRLRLHGCTTFSEYLDHLAHRDPRGEELREMINAVTTNKTSFFREAHHFDVLRDQVLARLQGRPIRIWSSACSSGEEPYTIAMVAREALGAAANRVRIFASDVDTNILARAERGIYTAEQLEGVPAALRPRYFQRGTGEQVGKFRVAPALRQMVQFRQVNLLQGHDEVPYGPFDAIFCRNVLIYFDQPTQRQVLGRFRRTLAADGLLFLGHSESLAGGTESFVSLGATVYALGGSPHPARRLVAVPATREAGVPSIDAPPRSSHRLLRRPVSRPTATATDGSVRVERIIAGGVFASRTPAEVRTTLGSCVAACIYDPVAHVGGMNHFLLPDGSSDTEARARYGVHAMEMLINEVMRLGGDRRRLVAKAFGGAAVLNIGTGTEGVGERNVRFIREFLRTEGIALVAERLGGVSPLEVRLRTDAGTVLVRALDRSAGAALEAAETQYAEDLRRQRAAAAADAVTLF